jgi:hypothetical protein
VLLGISPLIFACAFGIYSAFGLLTNPTMVVFGKARRTLLAKQFSDAANLAAAALIFGRFLSSRPVSFWAPLWGRDTP